MCERLRKPVTIEIVKNKDDFSWTIFDSLSCLLTNAVTTLLIRNRKAQRKKTVQRMLFSGNVAAINSNTIWQVFCDVFNNKLILCTVQHIFQLLDFSINYNSVHNEKVLLEPRRIIFFVEFGNTLNAICALVSFTFRTKATNFQSGIFSFWWFFKWSVGLCDCSKSTVYLL